MNKVQIEKCIARVEGFLESSPSDRKKEFRDWRNKGTFPRSTFPILLEMIQHYFDTPAPSPEMPFLSGYPEFSKLIPELAFTLDSMHIDDARCFYAQYLGEKDNGIYLAHIVRKWLIGQFDNIKSEMESIAVFLSRRDPSCIVDSKAVNSIYSTDSVGPFFSFSKFREECLPGLFTDASDAIRLKLENFSDSIKNHDDISDDHIRDLALIFKSRWKEIQGTAMDYTRKQNESNADWIFMAALLSGAKRIPANYYRFLMPDSIINDVDNVSKLPILYCSLSSLLVLEDGRIANLESSVDFHDSYMEWQPVTTDKALIKPFYNCSGDRPVPFTKLEGERVLFAAERFHQFARCIHQEQEASQLPLKLSTIYIFHELLNASLRKPITDKQLGTAYLVFWKKIRLLPDEERARLHAHRIHWDGCNYSVFHVLRQIDLGDVKAGCTTVWGIFLVKFVFDHFPDWQFNDNVECRIKAQAMRASSAKKTVIDYSCMSVAEITQRNRQLAVSLLTYSFPWSLISGCTLSYGGCKNQGIACLHDIIEQLKTSLDSTAPPRDVYLDILSNTIGPLILSGQMKDLPISARQWFDLIRGEHFFADKVIYDPIRIFMTLQPILSSEHSDNHAQAFLDDLIHTLLQPKNDSMFIVCINVKLATFLKRLETSQRNSIVEQLKNTRDPIHQNVFFKSFFYFITHQFSAAPLATWFPNFFGTGNTRVAPQLRNTADEPNWTQLTSLRDVFSEIERREALAGRGNPSPLTRYLREMSSLVMNNVRGTELPTPSNF